MQHSKNIAIVGSGLVGSLLAIYLRKFGHSVTVFDRRSDVRTIEFSGRSINLAMSTRGWKALNGVGIEEEIKDLAIALDKRAIHVNGQPTVLQKYGKEGEAIYSISRGLLNRKMIDLAEEAGVVFKFDEKIWDVEMTDATLYSGESERDEWKAYKYDMVFGADGAFSRIRHKMQRQSRFEYNQHFLDVAYKELTIPAKEDGTHKLDKNSFHIWPRDEFMLIAMPNIDGSFTCTLFLPFEGEISFETLTTESELHEFFVRYFPEVMDDIPNLMHDFFKNPTSALVTTKCYPWIYKDKIALIGDSAHAIVPFYGQGMNAGFEDISVLAEIITDHGNDWGKIFDTYQKERKPNADAVAELSYRNFMEMSSKTADASFLLRKKIEKHFAAKFPDKWIPVYSRVTFSNKPYAEALLIGDQQAVIMDELMKTENINENWESEQIENKFLELYEASPLNKNF